MRPQPIEIPAPTRGMRAAMRPARAGYLGLAAGVLDDPTLEHPCLQGYVVRWNRAFVQPEGLCAILKGAFDEDLAKFKRITALIDHNAALEIGCTDKNLFFHSDQHGIGFRLFVQKGRSEIAAAMVRAGDRVGMSAGINILASEWQNFGGQNVRIITKAELREASLVRSGAIPSAYAELVDASVAPSLKKASEYGDLLRGELYRNIDQRIRRLVSALERVGDA